MSQYLYDNYIVTLANQFERIIDGIQADYGFDYGIEFEVVICKALGQILPNKYGICRGHVVSEDGRKAGDDIIIFDQERFPTLRSHDRNEYSRKENIPIEAVYAYIEAKHTLDLNTFPKAFKQISDVKELIMERDKVDYVQTDPYINVVANRKVEISDDYPPYRNPVFCIILSRFATTTGGKQADNPQEIQKFLSETLDSIEHTEFSPDLIIAGKSNAVCIGYLKPDHHEIQTTLFATYHLTDKGFEICYDSIIKTNLAFGIAICNLLASIDWIRLGRMPWERILNNALNDEL